MKELKPIEIPEEYTAFAKSVAALADANGLSEFTMTIQPSFEMRVANKVDRRVHGEVRIVYRNVDRRGRPSEGLSIILSATHEFVIVNQPQSSS